jgi:hypothetical protein
MAAFFQLEVLYKGEAAICVPEYAELELHLTNNSAQGGVRCLIKLGSQIIKAGLTLNPSAHWSVPFNVADLVGELNFELTRADTNEVLAAHTIQVVPQKISQDELIFIKSVRLPTLLARLQAPNRLQISYTAATPDQTEARLFDFLSLEYTAEKLTNLSTALLKCGTIVAARLDYATPDRSNSGTGLIQGRLDLAATFQKWFNQPELAGYYHQWTTNPKFYGTLPNLLFLRFNLELLKELEQLRNLIGATPHSKSLQKWLDSSYVYMQTHQKALNLPELRQFRLSAEKLPDFKKNPELRLEMERACKNTKQPAYRRLYQVWTEFSDNYVSIVDETTTLRSGLQPMSKVYELWSVCEIAAALDLQCVTAGSANNSFYFKGQTEWGEASLHYNRAVRGGWYSSTQPGLPRPDLRLEIMGKSPRQIFFDVKYRVNPQADGHTRAKPEDMYKMLAYMNDFGVNIGGIIYPGELDQIQSILIEKQTSSLLPQRLFELALRPTLTQPHNLTSLLKQQLTMCLQPFAN